MNHYPESLLTSTERSIIQEKLLRLLSHQVERYTMGDSTSIRAELAQELLNSICCCLGITDQPDGRWRHLLNCDIELEYQKGLARIEKKKQFGRRLWQTVCTNLPPVENISMLDTLTSIGGFWKCYDSLFFAHEIPADIDYQLAVPVPEACQGIDYVIRYLENLLCENLFLSEYPADDLLPLLDRYCPDFRGLLVNLFEPVITDAIGLALLGMPDTPLEINKQELSCLYDLFGHMEDTQKGLLHGLERLREAHPSLSPRVFSYITLYCKQLTLRIDMLRDSNGLGGIFI